MPRAYEDLGLLFQFPYFRYCPPMNAIRVLIATFSCNPRNVYVTENLKRTCNPKHVILNVLTYVICPPVTEHKTSLIQFSAWREVYNFSVCLRSEFYGEEAQSFTVLCHPFSALCQPPKGVNVGGISIVLPLGK